MTEGTYYTHGSVHCGEDRMRTDLARQDGTVVLTIEHCPSIIDDSSFRKILAVIVQTLETPWPPALRDAK